MELRVLGAVRARSESGPVNLGHARQRSVLAVLLIEPNEPHPINQLADRVWGNALPHTAHNTLYGYLHRLRRALTTDGPRIVRTSGGYTLEVDEMAVDLHRFRSLVRRARTAEDEQAFALLDDALDLCRGSALTGVDSPWLDQVRHILERERTSAGLHRNDLGLRLGRHHALLAEVSAQAEADPLDECLAGQLMLTLYRCGRQAEALLHYQRVRRALADELGVVPGPQLRQVHQQILGGRPASVAGVHRATTGERSCSTSFTTVAG
ncbi:AfsR/SARP family transcriptional regulator [Saccharothrix sp. NRRL B-16314]|uniref:AfsR/SARP family transcriptional regulator n=1 Tax=Saccharothrix sp. NRRL B-16314 TaxID=1463825 RepID=UPI0018CC282C|nr:AfsR/SARP family transcriptional regulator [Saccharothrix sp. NRRL B-16314]